MGELTLEALIEIAVCLVVCSNYYFLKGDSNFYTKNSVFVANNCFWNFTTRLNSILFHSQIGRLSEMSKSVWCSLPSVPKIKS